MFEDITKSGGPCDSPLERGGGVCLATNRQADSGMPAEAQQSVMTNKITYRAIDFKPWVFEICIGRRFRDGCYPSLTDVTLSGY